MMPQQCTVCHDLGPSASPLFPSLHSIKFLNETIRVQKLLEIVDSSCESCNLLRRMIEAQPQKPSSGAQLSCSGRQADAPVELDLWDGMTLLMSFCIYNASGILDYLN